MSSRLLTSQTTPLKLRPTSTGNLVWRRVLMSLLLRFSIAEILREMWCCVHKSEVW
jgi:hypothetical protein